MANKCKKKVGNNVLRIREQLGYTQKQFGEILGISERMICNYETNESNLAPDIALTISKKWGYSLDYIYCDILEEPINKEQKQKRYITDKTIFDVDIRDFIACSNDKITIQMDKAYWDYILEVNNIKMSNQTDDEKYRMIAELDGKYRKIKYEQNTNAPDNSDIIWEASMNIEQFMSMIKLNNGKTCGYASSDKEYGLSRPTDAEIEEVKGFIESFVGVMTDTKILKI